MPAASTAKLSVQVSDFEDSCLLIQLDCLICDFCSSSQRFACGFLQIPPRDGHPCRPANDSPCRVRRRLSLPSKSALPGAQKKRRRVVFTPRLFWPTDSVTDGSSRCLYYGVAEPAAAVSVLVLFGCGVIRRYGRGAFQPAGNFSFAASSDKDGTMITSSPSFQFTGVATL